MPNPEPIPHPIPPRRRPLFLAGVLLFILGPALNFVQIGVLQVLSMPWYLPVLSTIGVACLVVSLRQRRSVARTATAIVLTLLCGFEWYGLVELTRTPPYTGAAQVGSRVPEFTATLADGTPFTNVDLAQSDRTAIVFFRGRW